MSALRCQRTRIICLKVVKYFKHTEKSTGGTVTNTYVNCSENILSCLLEIFFFKKCHDKDKGSMCVIQLLLFLQATPVLSFAFTIFTDIIIIIIFMDIIVFLLSVLSTAYMHTKTVQYFLHVYKLHLDGVLLCVLFCCLLICSALFSDTFTLMFAALGHSLKLNYRIPQISLTIIQLTPCIFLFKVLRLIPYFLLPARQL